LHTNLFISGKNASALVSDCEELFGTVAIIYVVKDEQAAIDLANDFNLGGSVFTEDVERGKK
jgi:acyl-CoA reductase-like NAD-dependent aldehyde dehydrogenase